MELKATRDRKGSEGAKTDRYVFGKVGGSVGGAIYITKGMTLPETLTIRFRDKEVDDAISEGRDSEHGVY